MTTERGPTDGVSRRTALKTGAMAAAAIGLFGPASAVATRQADATDAVDSPVGFGVELLAGHARFPDDVSARFRMRYDESGTAITANLPRDASSVVVAKVTWEPEGTSGWHTHPGPVVVSVVEGELELTNGGDCIPRRYAAGEAFVDPGQGNVHVASNPSTTAGAVAYATFLGVPDGAPATEWVEPVDCSPVAPVGHRYE